MEPSGQVPVVALAVFLVATYAAIGLVVARRLRQHVDGGGLLLLTATALLWPVVVAGIELGWLLGWNEWHFRPRR